MPINLKLKAFTIMELLVSMTLTGVLVVFAFTGYNQIQKLFINYTVQSKFISDYNQLNKALFIISDRAKSIESSGENAISFISDSESVILNLNEKNIVLKFKSHADTFEIEHKENRFDYLKLNDGTPAALIKAFECDVFFQSQKLRVSFRKEYDSETILKSTLVLLPTDEQY